MKKQEENIGSPKTQQRMLALLRALQHYKETLGITSSDDTHGTKADFPVNLK